jgi:hypothetical protein
LNDSLRRIGPPLILALVCIALAVLVVSVLTSRQAGSAYWAAPSCALATADPNDCYMDRPARITSVSFVPAESSTGGGSGYYTMSLASGEGSWPAQVSQRLLVRPPVVGEAVSVRIWRGVVTRITLNGSSATTYQAPPAPSMAVWWLVLIGIVVVGTVLALGVPSWNRLTRRRATAQMGARERR